MPTAPGGTAVVVLTGDTKGLDAAIAGAQAKVGQLGTGLQRQTTGAVAGVGNLREAFRTLAVQATGLNPQMARVVDVLGVMAYGSVVMAGALAGIAALSAAWRTLTSDQREAAESLEKWVDTMKEAGQIRALGGPIRAGMGQAILRRGNLQQLLESKRSDLAFTGAGEGFNAAALEIDRLEKELRDLNAAINEAGRQLRDQRGSGSAAAAAAGGRGLSFATPNGFLPGLFSPMQFGGLGMAGGAGGASPFAMGGGGGPGGIFAGASLGLTGGASAGRGGAGAGAIAAAKGAASAAKAISGGADAFANAGQVVVGTMASMAEAAINGSGQMAAAITGSGQMAAAITGALQNIIANVQTKSGGLFGATLPGMLLGAGIGIIGALVGRNRDPVRVNVDDFSATAAQKLAQAQAERPIHARLIVVTPEGRTVEETEYVLRNRAARDGVPRRTGPR